MFYLFSGYGLPLPGVPQELQPADQWAVNNFTIKSMLESHMARLKKIDGQQQLHPWPIGTFKLVQRRICLWEFDEYSLSRCGDMYLVDACRVQLKEKVACICDNGERVQ
jgi:hypothetical protein